MCELCSASLRRRLLLQRPGRVLGKQLVPFQAGGFRLASAEFCMAKRNDSDRPRHNIHESGTLAALLPKLLEGELRISIGLKKGRI